MKEKLKVKRLFKTALIAILAGIIIMLIMLAITKHPKFSWMAGCCTAIYYFILFVFFNYEHKKWWNALLVACCMGAITITTAYLFEKVDIIVLIFIFVIASTIYFPFVLCVFDTKDDTKKNIRRTRKPRDWRRYKTVEDIPNPTEREKVAIESAKWWTKRFNVFSNKESTGNALSDSLLILARSKTKDISESKIHRFEVELVRAITESNETNITLSTDYGPCGILWEISNKLGIPKSYFPEKYIMSINLDTKKSAARYKYDCEWEKVV